MDKIYKIIRSVVFALAGILVLIFNEGFISNGTGENINLYVGIVMAVFGLEGVIKMIVKKEIKEEPVEFLNSLINILLAVIMIFLIEWEGSAEEIKAACIIWATWSLMRVGLEVFEGVLEEFKEHPITSCLNFVKMGFVVVLSIGLIKCTEEGVAEVVEDAHGHVLLLGVELILEGVSCWLGKLEHKFLFKKEAK